MKSAITVLKHQKRGQSALEYLMSYGWAMVVVAVIVASLVILIEPGMVSTGNVSGFNQGIVLLNSAVPSSASESLQLVFVNQTGRQLHAMNLDVTDSTGAPVNGTASASSGGTWEGTGTFKIGAKETITFEPDSDWSGKSFTITVSYTDPDNFTRTAHGTMNTSFGSTGTPTNCGNGGVDPDEDCDGSDFDGETCNSLGAGSYGSLVCTGSCTINTSACHNCGNGIQEGSEQCDGSDFPLDAGCENYEVVPGEYFAPGKNATCSGVCMINTSTCSLCGNGGINGLEECDPGPPEELGGLTCMDLGYTSGSLACNSSCEFDESGCIGTPAQCGDGIKEGLEACDPPDYGMETCESLGFVSGDLHCKYDCSEITTWGCESCGNGLCESEYSEDFETCVDCSALCGNAICNLETGEDYGNCPADCDYLCGNGTCEPFYEENETNCVADCGACMPDTCEDLSQSIPCGLIVEPVCSTTIDCGECEYTQYECTEENECVCVPDITGICLESFGTDNCGIDMDFVCTQSVICGCPSGFTCTAGMARGPPAPTCAAITDGCQDDCAVSGIKRCLDADTIQECGNYDSDMCLEWGNAIECTAGENCVESVQNPFAMCRLP